MTLQHGKLGTVALLYGVVLVCLALTVLSGGCNQKKPPLSPEAVAFKQEILGILQQFQESLAGPVFRRDIKAINQVLQSVTQKTPGICLDCAYRAGVLNHEGDLVSSYPKTDIVGMNFSSYTKLLETIQRQRITQRPIFLPDGKKTFFISAPLVKNNRVVGAVVLNLTPLDLEKKWRLEEEEFLALDFNNP